MPTTAKAPSTNGKGPVPLAENEIEFLRALRDAALDIEGSDGVWAPSRLTPQELERRTGMSRPSVANVIKRFSSFLDEGDARPGAMGGRRVQLNADAGVVVAVDFGHSHLAVGCADLFGRPLRLPGGDVAYEEVPYLGASGPTFGTDLIDDARDIIRRFLKEMERPASEVVGVGIALPGPLDGVDEHATIRAATSLGTAYTSPFQTLKVGVHLREALASTDMAWREVPFLVDNDANLGALAERTWGLLRGADNAIFIDWSRGIGAGLILNGAPVHGVASAGELGHVQVANESAGKVCALCGSCGCLDMVAGLNAIRARVGLDEAQEVKAGIQELIEAVGADRRSGDGETASVVLDETANYLAQALAPLITVLNPSLVVIGGAVGSQLYDLIKRPLAIHLEELTMSVANTDVTVLGAAPSREQGALGRAALRGAVALVLSTQDPSPQQRRDDPVVTYLRDAAATA